MENKKKYNEQGRSMRAAPDENKRTVVNAKQNYEKKQRSIDADHASTSTHVGRTDHLQVNRLDNLDPNLSLRYVVEELHSSSTDPNQETCVN